MKITLALLAVLVAVAVATPVKRSADNAVSELLEELERRGLGKGPKAGKAKEAMNGERPEGGRPEGGAKKGGKSEDDDSKSKDNDEKGEHKDKQEKMFEMIAEKCGIKIDKTKMPEPVKKEQIKGLLEQLKSFLDKVTDNFEANEGIFAKAKDLENAEEVANTHKEAMDNMAKLGDDEVTKKAFCLRVKSHMLKYAVQAVGLDQAEFPNVPQCLSTCTVLVMPQYTKTEVEWDKVPGAIQSDHACLKAGINGVKALAQNAINKMNDPFVLSKVEYAMDLLFTRGHQLYYCSSALHKMYSQKAKAEAKPAEKPETRELHELIKVLDAYLKEQ